MAQVDNSQRPSPPPPPPPPPAPKDKAPASDAKNAPAGSKACSQPKADGQAKQTGHPTTDTFEDGPTGNAPQAAVANPATATIGRPVPEPGADPVPAEPAPGEAPVPRFDISGVDFSGMNLAGMKVPPGGQFSDSNFDGADMSGASMAGTTFENSTFNQTDLSGSNLRGAQFVMDQMSEADLTGSALDNADFTLAGLSQADLEDSSLLNTNLEGADLSASNMSRATATGADLSLANAQGAQVNDVDLNNASLLGTDLSGANLRASELNGSNLGAAQLQGADLTAAAAHQADLTAANLDGAIANDAQLDGATLIGTNANGAQMERADLHGSTAIGAQMVQADLRRSDLRDASMVGANLQGANLTRTKLDNTDLSNADLQGADLRGSNIASAQLDGANLNGAFIDNVQAKQLQALGVDISGAVVTSRAGVNGQPADWDVDQAPNLALMSNRPDMPALSQLNPFGASPNYDGQYNCAPASMAMAIRASGPDTAIAVGDMVLRSGDLSDAQLISLMGQIGDTQKPTGPNDPGGTSLNGVGEMAWSMGQPISMTEARGGALRPQDPAFDQEWLNRQLAAGKTVVANGRLETDTQSFDHYMAVVGRSANGNYVVNDPWTNRQLEYSGDQLHDFLAGNSQYGGAMLAIGGDPGYKISAPQVQPFPKSPSSNPPAAPSAPVAGRPPPAPVPQAEPVPQEPVAVPVTGVRKLQVRSAVTAPSTRPQSISVAPLPETAPFRPFQLQAVKPALTASRLALQARQPIAV